MLRQAKLSWICPSLQTSFQKSEIYGLKAGFVSHVRAAADPWGKSCSLTSQAAGRPGVMVTMEKPVQLDYFESLAEAAKSGKEVSCCAASLQEKSSTIQQPGRPQHLSLLEACARRDRRELIKQINGSYMPATLLGD